MKIYAIWSAQYRALRDDWFLATMPEDMEPVLVESPIGAEPGPGFRTEAWCEALDFKLEVLCEAMRRHQGEVICFSDVDVQFFGSFRQPLLEALESADLAGLREWQQGGINSGFFAVRCTPGVLELWEEIAHADKQEAELYDQDALNALLAEPGCRVRSVLLPDLFWASHRHLLFGEAEPGGVLVHHATGAKDKAGELRRWREKREALGQPGPPVQDRP